MSLLCNPKVEDGNRNKTDRNRDGYIVQPFFYATLCAEYIAFSTKSAAKTAFALLQKGDSYKENRQDDHDDRQKSLSHRIVLSLRKTLPNVNLAETRRRQKKSAILVA